MPTTRLKKQGRVNEIIDAPLLYFSLRLMGKMLLLSSCELEERSGNRCREVHVATRHRMRKSQRLGMKGKTMYD